MAKLQRPAKKTKVVTPVFRLCFPAIFQRARPMESDPPDKKQKYGLTAVFDVAKFDAADKKRWAAVHAIVDEASQAAWRRPYAKLPANFKPLFRDGEEKEHLEGFGAGVIFIKMTSLARPGVVGADGQTPIDDEEALYSGCYCRASVTARAYDNVSKGVSLDLHNVMFIRDGERIDGRSAAEEDFGEMGETADDDLS